MDFVLKGLTLFFCCARIAADAFESPCVKDWTYSKESGRCYKFFQKKSANDARNFCKGKTLEGAFRGRTDLGRLNTKLDEQALEDTWLKVQPYNREPHWILKDNVIKLVRMEYEMVPRVVLRLRIVETDNASHAFYCDFQVKKCFEGNPDPKKMVYDPGRFFPNTTERLKCREGYYNDAKAPSLEVDCSGNFLTDKNDPEKYQVTTKKRNKMPVCKSISCGPLQCVPNYMVTFNNTATGANNAFNTKVHAKCKRGFVNERNTSLRDSYLVCKQMTTDRRKGFWRPTDCSPCQAVRCSLDQLRRWTPHEGLWVEAVNVYTKDRYQARFQWNEMNLFGNVAEVRCNVGYFFPDRQITKRTKCDVENDDDIVGNWTDHQYTTLPIPKKCVRITCLADAVSVAEDYNMMSNFTYKDPETNLYKTLSKHQTEGRSQNYPFKAVLNFTCAPNFQTANQQRSQILECGVEGEWKPHITKCLGVQEKIDTGDGKHYIPPTVETQNSKSIGAIALIFALLLLGLIIVLDLSTVTRDVQYLRSNLILVRRYLRERSS